MPAVDKTAGVPLERSEMETQSSTPNVTGPTPGPWRVEDVAVNGSLAIMAGSATEYRWLATVSEDLEAGIDWTQTQANARLIAAAPELLSVVSLAEVNCANALELLTKEFNSGPSGVRAEAIAHIRKAILRLQGAMAKVEGREP